MRNTRTLFISLVTIVFALWMCALPKDSYAQTDFTLSFDVSYDFHLRGSAIVRKKITLTNQNTDTYPSVYLVDVPEDSSDIAVVNADGPIEHTTGTESGRTIVRIELPEHVVGFNQSTTFTISYETQSLTKREGEIWQISIPPFSSDERIAAYSTRVTTPHEWGSASYSSPPSEDPFVWTKDERGDASILMIFGEFEQVQEPVPTAEFTLKQLAIAAGIGILAAISLYAVYRIRFARHGS